MRSSLITALLVAASAQAGPNASQLATISGRTLAMGQPIQATITIDSSPQRFKSNPDGSFTITNVPAGMRTITARAARLDPVKATYRVKNRQRLSVTLRLADHTAPTQPTSLQLVGKPTTTTAQLKWQPATDNWAEPSYVVNLTSANDTRSLETLTPKLALTELVPNTVYTVAIQARDDWKNLSPSAVTTFQTMPELNLSGTAIDHWYKQPVERVNLGVTSKTTNGFAARTMITGADGVFGFWGLPTGDYEIAMGGVGLVPDKQSVAIDIRQRQTLNFLVRFQAPGNFRPTGSFALPGNLSCLSVDYGRDQVVAGLAGGVYRFTSDGQQAGYLATDIDPDVVAPLSQTDPTSYLIGNQDGLWWVSSQGQTPGDPIALRRLAVTNQGVVVGYQANTVSVIKNRTTINAQTYAFPDPDETITAISAGQYATFLATSNGRLYRLDAGFEGDLSKAPVIELPFVPGHLAYADGTADLFVAERFGSTVYHINARTFAYVTELGLGSARINGGLAATATTLYVGGGRQIMTFRR